MGFFKKKTVIKTYDKENKKPVIKASILWFICGGLLSGLSWVLAGLICCITIIGIPFGKQFFKIAKLSLMPFGAEVI